MMLESAHLSVKKHKGHSYIKENGSLGSLRLCTYLSSENKYMFTQIITFLVYKHLQLTTIATHCNTLYT